MAQLSFSWDRFYCMPVIGIMRNVELDDIKEILPLYHKARLSTIEITMNSQGCEESIRYAINQFSGKLNIGAGTVCTVEDLYKALEAGAQFIVTPVIEEAVIKVCKKEGIPVFAGAYTPTEIFNAWRLGADIVKIFPAITNGLEYIKAIKGPLPQIKLLPTGGIDIDNCLHFMKAGAAGLGVGSQLFHNDYIQKRDWSSLYEHFVSFEQKLSTSTA